MTAEMRTPIGPEDPRITLGPLRVDPRTIIYSTILVLTAVAIIDPGKQPLNTAALWQGFWILLGPLFAISMAHGFSEAIDLQIRLHRRLTWADRRHLLTVNLQYMFIGVIAWISLLISYAVGQTVSTAMNQLYVLGVASLVAWGVIAARHAGLPRSRQVVMGINYGAIGIIIVLVEIWIRH